ncbi:MAG: hypothetical protein IBX64_07130 [Actinobacteria bacterium]|nr:hypothetical protein [Actinomycetota bacterium]
MVKYVICCSIDTYVATLAAARAPMQHKNSLRVSIDYEDVSALDTTYDHVMDEPRGI